MKHVHFLIFRIPSGDPIRWTKPVGGLVLKAKKICSGVAVADFGLAEEIATHRYHCAPGEELILAEVLEEKDQIKSHRLHARYEREFSDFLELMTGQRP
jgi:hypothetical protein